jgi:hypothetical protein
LSESDLADPGRVAQEVWRKRLEEAENRYEEAAVQLETARAAGRGVDEARERKMLARAAYLRVLRIFSDLVLRGKAPMVDPGASPHKPDAVR